MIRSMTGYGRADLNNDEMTVTVEMRSLNHRYLEINPRLVKDYNFLEEKIISYLKGFMQRGKVDVYVSLEFFSDLPSRIELNHAMVKEYLKVFNELSKTYKIKNDIAVSDLAFNKDIFSVRKAQCNEKYVLSNVLKVLDDAIKKLIRMRELEGEKLYQDIEARIQNILLNIEKIEEISPNTVSVYRKRLEENLNKVLADINIDETRILTESAIFAEKICVSEETVRLKSHIEQFRKAINEGGPCGRKLDFITQEMNREANTIGSKAMDCSMTYIVVEIKSQLEKIREQVQNIE